MAIKSLVSGLLFSLLVGCAQANPFVMTPVHCEQLRSHIFQAIAAKGMELSYSQYLRDRMDEYREAPPEQLQVLKDIMPYSLQTAYEYFHYPFDKSVQYEQITYDLCWDNLGKNAQ